MIIAESKVVYSVVKMVASKVDRMVAMMVASEALQKLLWITKRENLNENL